MMILLRDWTLHNVECKKMKLESQKELSMKGTKKILYLLYTWQKSFETQHSHPNCILL